MRFFKIFLVCFFSLIGVVGGSLGVMYVAGSFNKISIEPTNIYFEDENYYVDGDFNINILTETENATETLVTLSLENQIGGVTDGKVTDGKITIPRTVYLGQSFTVEVLKAYSEELGKDWIIGGISTIIASSESDRAIDVNTSVYIDVPVDTVSIKTYSNDGNETPMTTFALGEKFFAEAVFSPLASKYKYSSTTETKKVIFDISADTSGSIVENQEMITDMQEAGKPYIYGYKVEKATSAVDIKAYCFYSALVEDNYINQEGITENELISVLKNTTSGVNYTQELEFTARTVGGFVIDEILDTNSLTTNTINKIYANSSNSALANLGIEITGSDDSSIQNKISDVGIRAYVMEGGNARPVTSSEFIFINYTNVGYASNADNSGAYYFDAEINGYYEVEDGELYQETFDLYYFPKVVSSNVNSSFWSVVPISSNLTVYFMAHIFENGDVIATSNRTLTTTQWQSTTATVSQLNWINEASVDLTFIDSDNIANQKIAEYNLSNNLQLSSTSATYTTVKFLAYSDDYDVKSFIQNATLTTKYNLTDYGIDSALYEISGSILSANKDGIVNIIAVIIKTDYLGRIVTVNEQYEVLEVSTPISGLEEYKTLTINVEKTIQNLTASIQVDSSQSLKNTSKAVNNVLSQLAFIQNQNTSVFKVYLTVTANSSTTIEKEIELFEDAWADGKIYLKAIKSGEIESSILVFDTSYTVVSQTDNSWTISFNVFTTACEIDTELTIKYFYEKTSTTTDSQYISAVNFVGDLTQYTFNPSSNAIIEVYDGKVSKAEFDVETSTESKVTKSYSIAKGEAYQDGTETKFYATDVSVTYRDDQNINVTDQIINPEDGTYLLTFYDRYDNEVVLSAIDYTISKDGSNVVATVTNYSSTLYQAGQPTATLYVTENNEGSVESVKYNESDVEDGLFSSRFESVDTSTTNVINVSRYGAKGSTIYLTGTNGLLNVEFKDYNNDIFELCNIIKYTILTSDASNVYTDWQTTYSGVLTISEDHSYISVEKSINNDIVINLSATTGLGETFLVRLTIVPNIFASYSISEGTAQTGATAVNEPYEYKGIYSDNDVDILLKYEMHLFENFSISCPENANGNTFIFKDTGSVVSFTNTLLGETTLTVNFNIDSLGKKEIFVSTGATDFDFKQSIKLNINANLQLKDATNDTLNLSIAISELDADNQVISSEDLERIISDSELDLEKVSLAFAKVVTVEEVEYDNIYSVDVYGNEVLNTDNLFTIYGFNIRAVSALSSTYKITINVNYGNAKIGSVILEVTTNMTPDNTQENYSDYFALYNGKLHLVLVAGTTYDYDDLKVLFNNTNSISFDTSVAGSTNFTLSDIGGYTIEILSIKNYTSLYCLHLKNSIGDIIYPVLFSPLSIGYIQYNETTATDVEATAETNSDIAKLNNITNLISNNVCDVYDSGKYTSLLQTTYTISLQDTEYTFKNYTNESVYILGYTNGGYYYKEIASISNTTYTFDLTLVPSGWLQITNEDIISSEFLQTETTFIGVFSSITEISSATQIQQNRGYGFSLEIYEKLKSDFVNINIYDEISGGFGTTSTTYATFNNDYFLLEPQIDFSTVDRIVWVVVKDQQTVIAKYRIAIEKNSTLNVYYPYGTGVGTTSFIGEESEQAEYVYLTGQDYVINFNNSLSVQYPNSISNSATYRVMLQRGSDLTGWQTATNATIIFTPYMISVGTINLEPEYFSHHISFANNILTIIDTDDVLVIYLKAVAQINNQNIGTEIIYKIFVNYGLNEFNLKDTATNETYAETEVQEDCGGVYDFSNYVLYDGNTPADDELNYYIYSTEGKDLSNYVDFDIDTKTLAVLDTVNLVSNLKVHFEYYTIYGAVLDLEITFLSSIVPVFNTTQTDVQIVGDNEYSAYADVQFSLSSIFDIMDNGISVGDVSDYWKYSLDDGTTYIDGSSMNFSQQEIGNYTVKVIVRMSDFNSEIYLEDYAFEFDLQILQSLKSNYPSSTSGYVLNQSGIVYSAEEYEVSNTIFVEDITTSIGYLFSVQDTEILNLYTLTAGVHTGLNLVTIDYELATNIFRLNFIACPTEVSVIKIWFTLTNNSNNYYIDSYLTFNLIPDVVPVTNYPEADSSSSDIYTFEAYYLNGEFVNHSTQNNVWNSVGSDYASVSLSETGLFGESRLKFFDNDGTEIIDGTKLAEIASRIKIVVSAVSTVNGNIIVAYDNGEELILNKDIDLDQAVGFEDFFLVKWVGLTTVLQNQSGDITFGIYIDGVYRTDYTLRFYSNAGQIFTTTINTFYDTKTFDSTSAEMFYVLDANTEKLFSNQTAQLTMTFKSTALSSTSTTLTAYVGQKAVANKVGEITVNNSISTITWILKGSLAISLDNLIISIGENDYVFNEPTNSNSIYKSYIQQDTCTLTNRLVVNYLNKKLSYDIYKDYIYIGASSVEDCSVYKGNANAIDTKNTINILASGQVIGSYYYTLVYDFKVDSTKEFDTYTPQFTVGGDNIDILDEYGITHYNGNEYTDSYFLETNVSINAYVILITNSDFENNQVASNVKYYNADKSVYCNEIKAGLTSTNTTWIDYVSLQYDQESDKTKRIYIELNGAENNGNYVYILFTYKANNVSADVAYTILKLKISSNWEYSAISDLNSLNQNTIDNALKVEYSSTDTINNISLINVNNTLNYISLYRSGTTTNLALSGAFTTFNLVGDIVDYLQIEKTSNSLILKKGTQVAEYGNKTGYILIGDKYGYEQKYYIKLEAQSISPLVLSDQIINSSDNTSIYESSTIGVVDSSYDTETSGAILTNYAFKIDNLDNLQLNGYTYEVTYVIEELNLTSENHDSGDPTTYNTGYIPAQSISIYNGSTVTLSLKIILEITNGSSTELIILTRSFNLLKRFETTGAPDVVVRDGQNFNVADYITITDNNADQNLGAITLSDDIYTLVVDEEYLGVTFTINVLSGGQNYANVNVIIGKDYKNATMTATNGKYYYPLNLFSAFSSIANYELYTYSVYAINVISQTLANPTDTVPTGDSVYLIKDKCLSIVTSNNNPTSYITVALNNGPYKVLIPFYLNYDGKQSKSIYEAITNLTDPEYPIATLLNIIYNYELDSTEISTSDLQLLKGISIYDETLTLKIDDEMYGIYYNVRVYYDSVNYKETGQVKINYNYPHYVYISLYNILGQEFGLDEEGVYKVQVIYAVGGITSGSQSHYISKVKVDGYDEVRLVTAGTDAYIYTITVDEFTVDQLEINVESQMFEDSISILTAQDFIGIEKPNVNKYYLVKYNKDDVVYAVSVNYTVTPKYYSVDDNGNTSGSTNKIVYANQYTLLYNSIEDYYYYQIDFDVWSNAYNLLDKSGNVLTTVKDAKDDLVFLLTGDEGLGAAILDENDAIITTSAFTEQHTVQIAVYVKVYEDIENDIYDWVYIDTISVAISKDTLYVPVAGTYNIIISATINTRLYSINIQHVFVSVTETISNLILTNINLASLVNVNNEIGFTTTDTTVWVPYANCDFSVVNVINDIYSAEYDGSKLNIKINLDETQNSIGKVISLQAVGRGIVNTEVQTSNVFQVTVGYDTTQNIYTLTASIGSGTETVELGTFVKINGYFTVSLYLVDIFDEIFVGTDYSYTVSIEEISSTGILTIVYSNDIVEATIDQTLFFHIAYTNSSNVSSSKIIGLKYTLDNQNYSGEYGYALDVSSLGLINIVNYTVSFLGGFDLDCTTGNSYNLLVAIKSTSINTQYSIAYVSNYSDQAIFEINDYANNMRYLPQNSLNNVTLYTDSVNGTTSTVLSPTIIKISSTATADTVYYYGVYVDSVSNMEIFGISTNTTDELYIDVSSYGNFTKITIKSCNSITPNISGDILSLFESSTTATTYWLSNPNTSTILYTKTNITKTTFVKDTITITLLKFDVTPGLIGTLFTSSELKTTDTDLLDLTAISGAVVDTYTYTFEIFQDEISIGTVEIDGTDLATFDLATYLSGLELSFVDGSYKVVYVSYDDNV